MAVSAFTIYQNLSAPEAKVTAYPIASVADYNRLLRNLRNKGVEESDLECPCSSEEVPASSFASIRIPPEWGNINSTTNICGTLTKLYSIFGFTKESANAQFCTPNAPWGRVEGTSLANCKTCLSQMSAAWPANVTDDRFFNTVPASYPFATPSGRVFLETVLPVLQRPCATLYKTQLLAAYNFNSYVLPASLLHVAALRQLVLQYALSQLSQLAYASNTLRHQLPLLALSQPQPSNLSWNATRSNLPQCDCQTLRSECNAFRFMPAFNDLPATIKERTNEDNDDSGSILPVNPLWSCNPLASAIDMFPSELFNMTTSRLLNSLGIPKTEECAAVFESQLGPRGGGWNSGWYSMIYLPGVNFPYTIEGIDGWVSIDFDQYFAACRPRQCTVVEDGDLSANWWLFLILTLAAIHMWLSVLHFAFEHAASAAALLGACCSRLRGPLFQRVSTRDADEAEPGGGGEKPPALPPTAAPPDGEEGGGSPLPRPASAVGLPGATDAVEVRVRAISPPHFELGPSQRLRSASEASHGSRASHGQRAPSNDTDGVLSSWVPLQQLGSQPSSLPWLAGLGGEPGAAAQRQRSSSAASRSSQGSRASSAFEEDFAVGLLADDGDAGEGTPM